jgi:hypothetical protein
MAQQAIASGDHLELVDPDLHLRLTLLFSEAFPNTAERNDLIQAIAVDNSTQRVGKIRCSRGLSYLLTRIHQIAAALDDHVAVWHKTSKDTYKVHSVLSTGFKIQCVDFRGGRRQPHLSHSRRD